MAELRAGEKIWRIGFLSPAAGLNPNPPADALRQGLLDFGYVQGRNLIIEYRWMAGRENDYRSAAHELADLNVDLIITAGHPAALAAHSATSRIPIIALAVVDPVGSGLAQSLSHPGGNITGFSLESTPETNAKMIQLLQEASGTRRVGVLWNSGNPGSRLYLDAILDAAQALRVTVRDYGILSAEEIDIAFKSLEGSVDGLVVFPEPLMWTQRQHIVDMARLRRLPTIYGWRDATEIMGGLMSYGPDLIDLFRRAGGYVDKILKGANPAELPIQEPTKFELIVNLNTAKALGLNVPPTLLATADKVIE